MSSEMECAICGNEAEKDWAEMPPHPKCFGCHQADQHMTEDVL